jgi:hypothetical protein
MSFIKTIPVSSEFYRSANDVSNLNGYWFGINPNDTFGYGSITGIFRPNRELKLIDITNQDFLNDFMNKLTEHSQTDPTIEILRNSLLFPIGFPNMDIYRRFCNNLGLKMHYPPNNIEVELATQFFGNRSRCSIKSLDVQFMEYLKTIYPRYDGIIAPVKLPNIIFNGFHHAEIGVFNTNLFNYIGNYSRPMSGGNCECKNELFEQPAPKMLIAIDIQHPLIDATRKYLKEMKENDSFPKELIHKEIPGTIYPEIKLFHNSNQNIHKNTININPTRVNIKFRKTRKHTL